MAVALLLAAGCAHARAGAESRIVVFNQLGKPAQMSISVDGVPLYGGIAAPPHLIEPPISFSVTARLHPGRHAITVRALGGSASRTFTTAGVVTIEVRLLPKEIRIVVHEGTLVFL